MTVIVVASVAGAPGATSLAVGLAAGWPAADQRRVLIEADPDGGRLGAELGVGVEPGLMTLALAARSASLTADDVVASAAAAIADWSLVPAPPSPEQAHSALVHGAPTLAAAIAGDDGVLLDGRAPRAWIADAGRLDTRSPTLPLAQVAAHLVLVTHGAFPELQLVPHRVEALRRAGCRPDVVVVEPTSWSAAEIADFVGADVLTVLPRVGASRRGVTGMRANAWRPWWNAVEDLATYLGDIGASVPADADPALDVASAGADLLDEAVG